MTENDRLDILLSESDGDLDTTGGQLHFALGSIGVRQLLDISISTFLGEWFNNLEQGVPYFQELLGHKFRQVRALSIFRDATLTSLAVTGIDKLTVNFNTSTRKLDVDIVAITELGKVNFQRSI